MRENIKTNIFCPLFHGCSCFVQWDFPWVPRTYVFVHVEITIFVIYGLEDTRDMDGIDEGFTAVDVERLSGTPCEIAICPLLLVPGIDI